MRHRDDAEATRRTKSRDRFNHEERVGWIERRCRLVEEERLRVAQQRPRDRHALLLAPGERGGLAVEKFRLEPDFSECRCQSVLGEIAGTPGRPDAEIVAHRPLEHHRRLHDERDATPKLAGIERSDVAAVESHRARRRLDETVETAKQTRLPRPRRADERERMPALHAEGDIVQDLHCGMAATIRIVKREMIDLENRIVLVLVVGGRHNSAVAHSKAPSAE